MRLVDTSAWIEWLLGSQTGGRLHAMMPTRDRWLVPTIVQLELAKWLTRELGEERADQMVTFTQTCLVAPLTTPIALIAADISRRNRLATADAIIYATALEYGANLLTCDAHFHGLAHVEYVGKSTGQT